MPLPLIPILLIGGGVLTGGSGILLGGKGALQMKEAQERLGNAGKAYQMRYDASNASVAHTNDRLRLLGEQQRQSLSDVVVRMGEFLRRNERLVRESQRLLVDGLDVTTSQIASSRSLDVDAKQWIAGALGSATAGAGTAAGVTALAGSIGVASTGTAISGLTGAAAESATLALLGGGSLASGGGGMALGATALNAVTIGPALLVGGLVIKGQGTKALTQARRYEAEIAVASAELDELDVRLSGIESRIEELGDILGRLTDLGVAALDELESEPFDPAHHAERFQRSMTYVMAVRDVATTPIVDQDGDVDDRADLVLIKYRDMADDEREQSGG